MNLYVRYDTEENDTGAIIKIEQLKNHPAGIIPAKAGEAWTPRQMDLEIAWRRWRLVRDKEVVDPKVVQAVMDAATEDSTIVMDVVTWLDTQNRSKEADALFEKRYAPARAKVDLNPADPHYNNALAWICARSNRRLDEALAAAEKAVSARPTEAAYLDTLAEVKFRLGDIEDAISLEERALLGRPRDVFMAAQLDRFRKALSSNQK
jgi:tetratricopeptide (TPR) repeat protein